MNFSNQNINMSIEHKKLCDDLIDKDLLVVLSVNNLGESPDLTGLLDELNKTKPVHAYNYGKTIYLVYSADLKYPMFRSNLSGDIISHLVGMATRYLIKNQVCDPYYISTELFLESYENAKTRLDKIIETNDYLGYMVGVEDLKRDTRNPN